MSQPSVLQQVISDDRAWTADTIDAPASWHCSLSDECVTELDVAIRRGEGDSRPLTETRIDRRHFEACAGALLPAVDALNSGRGFVFVDPPGRLTANPEHARSAYWYLGQLIGAPFEQDIAGSLLYDVRDTGQSVTAGSRFSVTNAESTFHTDNAFNPRLPDVVGLLCLQPARSGGRSQLLSAYAVHNALLQRHSDLLEALYRNFCFDRRGQLAEGESPVSEFPIFHWDGGADGLTQRYMRYYIEVGHERTGRPLTGEQQWAIEALEELLRQPSFRVEFDLTPGQMLFTSNRWILHNRTAFEDYPQTARRRHLIRLWLSRATQS
jgi:alpha-ketoglutarate-dependent taurine dioxygenase